MHKMPKIVDRLRLIYFIQHSNTPLLQTAKHCSIVCVNYFIHVRSSEA